MKVLNSLLQNEIFPMICFESNLHFTAGGNILPSGSEGLFVNGRISMQHANGGGYISGYG